ncbi:hypothetical protein M9H77_14767 [Catharanthus roseus]|uniref:Uncharacterized protein n=1 Tax=Catharanthus roseus TaxID=4058 RepID=A0ACC0BP54_CATRO|nr:hypothetical protein M9H77_14767 [Catharanthus roseus]
MSINHFSSSEFPESLWWTHDVGKLNRLVIPKQHAEKYFPLNNNNNSNGGGGGGGGGVNGSNESGAGTGEKGFLLSFEDEIGKPWRFRYSYWNSSQSYVLTKGWSRFVKEKRLDAGDIVLFERHRFDCDRLFIGWRRRGSNTTSSSSNPSADSGGGGGGGVLVGQVQAGGGGGVGWTRMLFSSSSGNPYPGPGGGAVQQGHGSHGPAIPYQPDCLHAVLQQEQEESQRNRGAPNGRKLRLFGVNLDLGLQPDDSTTDQPPPTPDLDPSSLSIQGQGQGLNLGQGTGMGHYQYHHHHHRYYSNSPKLHHHPYNHQNHMVRHVVYFYY